MCDCVGARPAVVPVKSFLRVARDADVVSRGIRNASQDVNKPLSAPPIRQVAIGPAHRRGTRLSDWSSELCPRLCPDGCLPSTNTITYRETPRDSSQGYVVEGAACSFSHSDIHAQLPCRRARRRSATENATLCCNLCLRSVITSSYKSKPFGL
jgi:hypothetical protein